MGLPGKPFPTLPRDSTHTTRVLYEKNERIVKKIDRSQRKYLKKIAGGATISLMSSSINKDELEHLAKLARIELDPSEEEKLLADLGNILEHFKELQELDTTNVAPMTGGTDLKNIFRDDNERVSTNRGAGTEAFPESKDGYLKVPSVFE